MKRKIVTKKQLDRLVSLGVVERNSSGYVYDNCTLFYSHGFHGRMARELLGKTVDVEDNNGNELFPFRTKECDPWNIPAFILSCNYKKMIARGVKNDSSRN